MSAESRDRFAAVVRDETVRLDLALLLTAAETLPADRATGVALDRYLDAGLAALDDLAATVPPSGRDDARLRASLGGFSGGPEPYRLLESSLLPEVLRRRRGLPILLASVWTETARRAGIPAYGVGLPGHFVVGLGDPRTFPDGPRLLVDPFDGGRLLPYDRARDLVERSGSVFRREHLAPHDPVATVARVLANIRAWADDSTRASVRHWASELALLLPRHDVSVRRDRGVAAMQLGDYLAAARDLDQYADAVGPVAPRDAEEARALARRARAHLN